MIDRWEIVWGICGRFLFCFFVANNVCSVKDFKCFVWQMSRASPFALRHREFVQHVATGRPCVALARVSLWLLLAGDYLPKAVV